MIKKIKLVCCNNQCPREGKPFLKLGVVYYSDSKKWINEGKNPEDKKWYCSRECGRYSNSISGGGTPELERWNFLVKRARDNSRNKYRKQKEFDPRITGAFVKEMFEAQGKRCKLTGIKMIEPCSYAQRMKDIKENGESTKETLVKIRTAVIDRIDSDVGYLPDNLQVVCHAANNAKNIFSNDEIIEFFNEIRWPK